LIDVPVEFTNDFPEEELNRYFNTPEMNKKYGLKGKMSPFLYHVNFSWKQLRIKPF
jgi:hypothetical protein